MNKTPFELGYKAWYNKQGINENPFPYPGDLKDPEGKSDYWLWYAGWQKADRENV